MEPRAMIERAKRIFGPVAEKIGEEILGESGEEGFEEKFIEKLSQITGNRKLVENILLKEE